MKDKVLRVWQFISPVWKDPVISKLIAVLLAYLILKVYALITKQSVTNVLTYPVPLFFILLGGVLYLVIRLIRQLSKPTDKVDPVWEERIGNYVFKDLFDRLAISFLPPPSAPQNNQYSGIKTPIPESSLLVLFHAHSTALANGVGISTSRKDSQLIFHLLAPHFLGYGLVKQTTIKSEANDPFQEKAYQLSDDGFRFKALLEGLLLRRKDIFSQLVERKRDS